jgi:NAD(P)-dependent dehydrogenase (short-subunit alcohol dehydrogenase family)
LSFGRFAVSWLSRRSCGTIVNVVSVKPSSNPTGLVIEYGAAKAALLNVAKALSQELGTKGIRINSIRPAPSRPTSGSASTAPPLPTVPQPASTRQRSASKRS